jgi:hypothetical protein
VVVGILLGVQSGRHIELFTSAEMAVSKDGMLNHELLNVRIEQRRSRTHTHTHTLSLCLSVSLWLSVSVCLCVSVCVCLVLGMIPHGLNWLAQFVKCCLITKFLDGTRRARGLSRAMSIGVSTSSCFLSTR